MHFAVMKLGFLLKGCTLQAIDYYMIEYPTSQGTHPHILTLPHEGVKSPKTDPSTETLSRQSPQTPANMHCPPLNPMPDPPLYTLTSSNGT